MLIYKNNKMVYNESIKRANLKYRKANKDLYNEYSANYMATYRSNPERSDKLKIQNNKRYICLKEFQRFRNILMPDL